MRSSVRRTQEAEISFLRAQINPHFLYNALNSIAALCATAPDKAEEVTVELSRYLRRSFDFKRMDAMSTLTRELELLEAYLYIEKTRFGDRLRVEYDIEEGLSLPMPPLMLQPLVENAVRHGLMSRNAGGMVTVSIWRLEDEAVFTISDDGVGMDDAERRVLLEESPERRGGIGVWNINQRLKMLYGGGLTVYCEKGRGTSVSFRLPLRDETVDKSLQRKETRGHERNHHRRRGAGSQAAFPPAVRSGRRNPLRLLRHCWGGSGIYASASGGRGFS